jgi:hypothetical protein
LQFHLFFAQRYRAPRQTTNDGRFPNMNVSHLQTVMRALQRPKSIAGSGVWRRVPIVDAYLFGHVWQAAREGAAMFAGLVFVFAIVAGAREGGEPLEASVWLRVLALQMPRVLSFTLPMALLYGCVKAFSELSERGELAAWSAAGQGWPRVLRAPLLLGMLAGLGALFYKSGPCREASRRACACCSPPRNRVPAPNSR